MDMCADKIFIYIVMYIKYCLDKKIYMFFENPSFSREQLFIPIG